ncbi:probable oxidoreductase [Marinomonas sp. MED121]|uniref:D-arabinono-1,4-lactone oxidase n=1 Tax=Marinomonas sp. MED121 TaxID=314277 RepID=UPI0000690442|nr:D-arabinono-1,4-lactone oxidase [Marinomonas sp. MED121]EAQ66383.1 probable oxidoreductase [Marinomonas sp. MED121]
MISRRNLLGSLIGTAVGASLSPNISIAEETNTITSGENLEKATRKSLPWRNWSGSQECFPQSRIAPKNLTELQQIITQTKGHIRPVGAGHSFSPLVPTQDTILSLSRMTGVISHDESTNQAVIMAGTRLGDIGKPLAERGQAMINMPDIDEQTLAGALGTATHGTGASLGCLSDFVEGLELMTANGEVLSCDRQTNSDIFQAARVNLGALGIVTQIRLQNMPKYRLRRETTCLPIDEILDNAEQIAQANRNFEFFYIPFSGYGLLDTHNITDEAISVTDKIDQNDGTETLKQLRDWLAWSPRIREYILSHEMQKIEKEVTIANSWQNYAQERNVRFNEMEYHLPREFAVQAFREIRDMVEKHFDEVFFPFEFRFVKSDYIWLSPFNGRETCSIAVHRFYNEDYQAMFKAVEPIFKKYRGRPHWGKLNSMQSQEFAAHYANWQNFKDIRQSLDPEGKFLNPYLKSLFDIA